MSAHWKPKSHQNNTFKQFELHYREGNSKWLYWLNNIPISLNPKTPNLKSIQFKNRWQQSRIRIKPRSNYLADDVFFTGIEFSSLVDVVSAGTASDTHGKHHTNFDLLVLRSPEPWKLRRIEVRRIILVKHLPLSHLVFSLLNLLLLLLIKFSQILVTVFFNLSWFFPASPYLTITAAY